MVARTGSGGRASLGEAAARPKAGLWKALHFAAPAGLVDAFWAEVNARGGSAIRVLEDALDALKRDPRATEALEQMRAEAEARRLARIAKRYPKDDRDEDGVVWLTMEEAIQRRREKSEARRVAKAAAQAAQAPLRG